MQKCKSLTVSRPLISISNSSIVEDQKIGRVLWQVGEHVRGSEGKKSLLELLGRESLRDGRNVLAGGEKHCISTLGLVLAEDGEQAMGECEDGSE